MTLKIQSPSIVRDNTSPVILSRFRPTDLVISHPRTPDTRRLRCLSSRNHIGDNGAYPALWLFHFGIIHRTPGIFW